MVRVAFRMRLLPGTAAEYRRRHREVWPELLADLRASGCHNYSIFLGGEELFAYMELDDVDAFVAGMAGSDANRRWQVHMDDILRADAELSSGLPPLLEEVFHLD